MTLTTMDAIPALVAIDLQTGIADLPTVHPVDEIAARTATLAHAFRNRGLPVVLVNVAGAAPGRTDTRRPAFAPTPEWIEILESLEPAPSDLRITKMRWGAFHGTSLDSELRAAGVTQILLTGVSTSGGVESTARAAYEHGYNVVLVSDAMTDSNADAHRKSIELVFPKLGEVTTSAAVLAMLERRT